MAPRSRFVSACLGKPRRVCCCWVFGPPRSAGQVSKATHGVIAMRAPSGHLIGFRFGLTFMLPPSPVKFFYTCHSSILLPTILTANRSFCLKQFYSHGKLKMDRSNLNISTFFHGFATL